MFQSAADVIDTWFAHVNAGSVDDILSLYDETACLLPTFSNQQRVGLTAMKDYFEMLAARENMSVGNHEKTVQYHEISDSVVNVYGICLWKFKVDSEILSFEARFTFTLNMTQERPIVHHHSSQVPRSL